MSMQTRELGRAFRPVICSMAALVFVLGLSFPTAASAGSNPKAEPKITKGSKLVGMSAIGLPNYVQPAAFHEDLVITNEGKPMTMKRFVDHGKIRTEIEAEGHDLIMIETGDSKGTMYTLMPEEKRAMKQSVQAMKEKVKMPEASNAGDAPAPPPDMKVEDLGDETLEGKAVKKLRMVTGKAGDGDVLGWFDKTTGAPVRMETMVQGQKSTIEWKNRKAEPQPAELFGVPKGYELMDMDEMMKKMGGM